jgi:hypothetical protein
LSITILAWYVHIANSSKLLCEKEKEKCKKQRGSGLQRLSSAVGRSENLGGQVVIWEGIICSLVEKGLTDLPKTGLAKNLVEAWPSCPPRF